LTRRVEIFIDQKFYADEYFVRAIRADVATLHCVQRLIVGATKEDERNSSVDSLRRIPITARKSASLSPCKLIATVHRASMTFSRASYEGSAHSPQPLL
jgi:hypothetical protein